MIQYSAPWHSQVVILFSFLPLVWEALKIADKECITDAVIIFTLFGQMTGTSGMPWTELQITIFPHYVLMFSHCQG